MKQMFKKFLKIVGIFFLTILGLFCIVVVWGLVGDARVSVRYLIGNGKVYVHGWDGGYVSAQGTWVLEGERHASPINVSDINCFRSRELCHIAEARMTDFSGNALSVIQYDLPITRWDSSTLEFEEDARCLRTTYVINRTTQKLIYRRMRKQDVDDDEACDVYRIKPDLSASLVDGFDELQDFKEERLPTTTAVIAATVFVLFMLAWAVRVALRKPTA